MKNHVLRKDTSNTFGAIFTAFGWLTIIIGFFVAIGTQEFVVLGFTFAGGFSLFVSAEIINLLQTIATDTQRTADAIIRNAAGNSSNPADTHPDLPSL